MPYASNAALPPNVRDRYRAACQTVWRNVFNETLEASGDEGRAFRIANTAANNCQESTKMSDPRAVKFVDGSDNIIEGLAIPFGGPFAGKDFHGEDFGPDTDLALDWFPEEGRPTIYHHGLDPELKTTLVGRQIEREERPDLGHWVKVQLDKRNRYMDTLRELVEAGALSFSSGAVPHLVQTRKDGHIEVWPWTELSLEPTPANPGAVVYAVKMADAVEHLAAVRALPEAMKEAIDESTEAALAGLPYADHAARVLADVTTLVERSQDIADLRAKAGRRISVATRERLEAVRDQAQQVIADMDALLVDPEREAETRKAVAAEALRFLREQARINGVAIEV